MNNKLFIAIIIFITTFFISYTYLNRRSENQFDNLSNTPPSPTPILEDLLLPDLGILPSEQLFIDYENDTKKLRFSSGFTNQGDGPLEMIGENDEEDRETVAIQKIMKVDSSLLEREIGRFIFHPDHNHWHIENFVIFELWSINDENEKDILVASTEKLSFCIWDEEPDDLSLENAPKDRQFPGCEDNDVQGLSIGWKDIYEADIPGQELDITDVSDGTYISRSVINPDQNILESNYENNEVSDYIRISGDEISKIDL